MQIRFDGKTIVVSGTGHGFGRCIAETFAQLGARVFGCDLSAAELAQTARVGVETEALDLTDRVAAAAWIAGIEQTTGGAVDVLVNNAGGVAGQEMHPIEEVPDADWDRVFAVNIGAVFALSRAVAAGMKRAGSGRIVNISSGAGLGPSLTGIQAYCSAKHAVVGLTRQLAHELGPFGITVNSVAPSFVRSNPASERQWAGYGDPTLQKEDAATQINGRVVDNTLQQFVLFLVATTALSVNLTAAQMRIIPAAAMVFVMARAAFWVGYRIHPLYRAFGMAATGYLNAGLLGFALWKASLGS